MSRQRSDAAPSQRQLRVGEQVRHRLAEYLMRGDLHDRHLETVSVTVSEVRMSRDLRHAQVFVAELGHDAEPATLEALTRVGPFLAGRIARETNLKYAPKLRFEPDPSFSHAQHIEQLIDAEIRSQRASDSGIEETAEESVAVRPDSDHQ